MHNQLKELLPKAIGESHHVIVVVIDIRGFSKFSQSTDSADVATYISKIYLKLINIFSELSNEFFYKTTGDGMLMTFPYLEDSLNELYNNIIQTCFDCHKNFKTLLKDDKMINFKTPEKIGFGVSRGTACALISSSKSDDRVTLDYSGHKLNIASRFQDLARPSGIVIEGPLDRDLLNSNLKKLFVKKNVFIKSVAESKPINICVTNTVKISQSNLHPFNAILDKIEDSFTPLDFKNQKTSNLHIKLKQGEIDKDSVIVKLFRPSKTGGESWKKLVVENDFSVYYEGRKPKIVLKFPTICKNHRDFLKLIGTRQRLRYEIQYLFVPK